MMMTGPNVYAVFTAELRRERELRRRLPPPEFPTDRRLLRVCYHEAGHGVVASFLGYPVISIAVLLDGPSGQDGIMRPQPYRSDAPLEHRILITEAGPEAERRHYPPSQFDEIGTLNKWDLPQSTYFIAKLLNTSESDPVVITELQRYRARAAAIVARNWSWVERVAHELARWRRLDGAAITRLRRPR